MTKKYSLLMFGVVLFFSTALRANAQGGCIDSPENPTVILALVGSAGVVFPFIRSRIKARRTPGRKLIIR